MSQDQPAFICNADAVVLHIGTNDLSDGETPETIIRKFKSVVDTVRNINSGGKIINEKAAVEIRTLNTSTSVVTGNVFNEQILNRKRRVVYFLSIGSNKQIFNFHNAIKI